MPHNQPQVYLNGEFIPAPDARLAIFDAGIVMGATLTEMTRTFRHVPFRLEDHVARLYRSCKYANITPAESPEQTLAITRDLVDRNASHLDESQELGIVHFLTPGEFAVYAGAAGMPTGMKPTYCIHTFPLPLSLWRHYYTEGVHVVTPSIRHVPPQCTDPKIKNRSRMHWWLADQQAHLVDPRAVPVLLDLNGSVTETSGSNLCIVTSDTVVSPTPRNILWGISISTIEELCQSLDVPFVRRDFQTYDLVNADEAFLASTPYCLAPITRVNGLPIANADPNSPMIDKLLYAWSSRVGLDIREQILSATDA